MDFLMAPVRPNSSARPRTLSQTVGGGRPPLLLVRLLGARMLAQGLIQSGRPTRDVLLAGSGVDAVHALSMLAAAVRFPDYRRPALTSGTVAAAAAGIGAALGRLERRPAPSVAALGRVER